MRIIEVLVPDSSRDDVLAVLRDKRVDYVLTAEDSDREASVVRFPLPKQAVETVLDRLRDAGLSEDDYTVVAAAESAQTPHYDELEEKYVEGSEEDSRIAHEEIRATALDMTPDDTTYYAMTLLSAVVATAGLLLDSPAIVVGSMVIAPLVGSAMTASVGVVMNDREMVRQGGAAQLYGLAIAVVGALVFTGLLRVAGVVPAALDVTTIAQVTKRASPGLLSLVVALAAGAAGAFGLATALPVSLVGVMIAAAIVPAAAAVGIGLAAGHLEVALGAGSLLVANTLAINVVGVVVLRLFGYRQAHAPDNLRPAGRTVRIATTALVLLTAAAAGAVLFQQMAFENTANEAVGEALDRQRYADLELRAVQAEFNDRGAFDSSQRVTVVVARPTDSPYPNLADEIARQLARRIDQRVSVEVEFVERQRATA
jgi:uncharacterized hydrophobic protein (TIGR00341 family)